MIACSLSPVRRQSVPKRLERLMFVRNLGTGAGTTVSLMQSPGDQRYYCRKSVVATAPNWESQRRQLKNEFDVGIHNHHPVLRKSFDHGVVRRNLRPVAAYNVLQYVEGMPLASFAATVPLHRLLKAFYHVADGLQHLHSRGVLHADLKPLNILCAKNGRPTIIDFGQACPILTRKERIQGTRDYIAPEQVALQALDARTDIFGLGATMHFVFFGRPVNTELNGLAVTRSGVHVSGWTCPTGAALPREIDPIVRKLIADCCQPDRARRPESMKVVKDRLEIAYDRLMRVPGAVPHELAT